MNHDSETNPNCSCCRHFAYCGLRQEEGRRCPAASARPGLCGRTPKPAPPPARTATTQRPAATTPAPRYPNAATRARIDQLLAKIEDAYFDYDKASLRPDALKALAGRFD